MPYQATVYNVMIASPSDVDSERKFAREAITEWNSLHSDDRKIVLLPIGWDTHTAPEMGAHPQIIIDKQILVNADLLIGIFLHRLGTPTLDAQSGTAHEIDSHTGSGKPAMIYFLEEKVDPSQFDVEQYEKLMGFKNDLKKKGLLNECTIEEFRDNLLKHLTITVNKNEYIQTEAIKLSKPVQQEYDLQFDQRAGIFMSKKTGFSYCTRCYYSSPSKKVELKVQDNGWRCNACGAFYSNPDYDPPTHARNNRNPMMM